MAEKKSKDFLNTKIIASLIFMCCNEGGREEQHTITKAIMRERKDIKLNS